MYPYDHITLDSILPGLPVEAQSWIKDLDVGLRDGLETILDKVGPEAFAAYWQDYKAEVEFLDRFFGC
jgi:hypothetical protein